MATLKKLNLYKFIARAERRQKKLIHAAADRGVTSFLSWHSKALFQNIINKGFKFDNFYQITDTTKRRISNIPLDDLKDFDWLSKFNKSNGLVFFNDKLHFIYHISASYVDILISSKRDIIKISETPELQIAKLCQCFLRLDLSSGNMFSFYDHPVDAANNPDNLLSRDPDVILRYKRILATASESGDFKSLEESFLEIKTAEKICLQAFLFIYTASVLNTTLVSDSDNDSFLERYKANSKSEHKIIRVDTLYDTSINVINPFSVKGHFRNQPYGEGRKETRKIWIDSFMKTGYKREATKSKLHN